MWRRGAIPRKARRDGGWPDDWGRGRGARTGWGLALVGIKEWPKYKSAAAPLKSRASLPRLPLRPRPSKASATIERLACITTTPTLSVPDGTLMA
jgi:hypothetical protein